MLRILRRPYQSGQAAVFGLAILIIAILTTLHVFNTGQLTAEKMRLTNNADAAAYSAAVWEARSLNFQAYMNRAMVANQVAVAQMVSWVSWVTYIEKLVENADIVGYFFWPLKAVTSIVKPIVAEVKDVLVEGVNEFLPIMDQYLEVLSDYQNIMNGQALAASAQILDKVVKANDPNHELTMVSMGFAIDNGSQWTNLTERYSNGDGMARKEKVVQDSGDDWVKNRGWRVSGPDIGIIKVTARKEGQAKLQLKQDDPQQWKAKDTFSLHLEWWCFSRRRGWHTCNAELPVGWGASLADPSDYDSDSRWGVNRSAERLARSNVTKLDGYEGLKQYRGISNFSDKKNSKLTLVVEVSNNGNNIRTSTKAGVGSGQFHLPDNMAKNKMSAMSKVEIFFERPANTPPLNGDKDIVELSNIYNPYWQVRLVEPSKTDRLATWAPRIDNASSLLGVMFK